MFVCVFGGEGAAPVILSQLIAVFHWTLILPFSPENSGAFRWAYLSTHTSPGIPKQLFVELNPCLPLASHSASGMFLLTDTLLWPLFLLPGTHYHLIFFSFFRWATKRQQRIIDWSVHKNVILLKVRFCSYVQGIFVFSHLTRETSLARKVHLKMEWVCTTRSNSWPEFFSLTRQPLKHRGMFLFQFPMQVFNAHLSLFCLLFLFHETR